MPAAPRILALSGSLRKLSANAALLRACAAHGSATGVAKITLTTVDLPLFNSDVESVGHPASVRAIRDLARSCDSVLVASTEYNNSFSPILGNALAWLSRDGPDGPSPISRKPYAMVSAAGYSGGMHAQKHLRDTMHYLKMPLLEEPDFFLNIFDRNAPSRFDATTGDVTDDKIKAKLGAVVDALAAWTVKLGSKS